MMNGRKVLLLGVLLLLPVLAFLFLQSFGRNAYKLRTYLPEPMAAALVGAPLVSGSPAGGAANDTVYHRVDDAVALRTATGAAFSPARDLRGHVVVLSFGQGAASTDRALLRGLARVQNRYRARPALKLLTVVPASAFIAGSASASAQAPADLAALAERSGAISGKWLFVQAEPAVLTHLYTELRDTLALANPAAPSRLWLLDGARHLRGHYAPTDPREIDRLLTEIDVLLKIEGNPARP